VVGFNSLLKRKSIFSPNFGIFALLNRLSRMVRGKTSTSPSSSIRGSDSSESWNVKDIEEYLMNLCLEFAEKGKLIQVDPLFQKTRKNLKVPRMQIETAIDNLIQAKKIIPGQFLHSANILENDTRNQLYNAIAADPAEVAFELKHELALGSRMLAWHLKKLLDFGLIKKIPLGKQYLFAVSSVDEKDAIIYRLISKNPMVKIILSSLQQGPLSRTAIVNIDPDKRTAFFYYLNNLEQIGVIEIMDTKGEVYQITSNYFNCTQHILNQYFCE